MAYCPTFFFFFFLNFYICTWLIFFLLFQLLSYFYLSYTATRTWETRQKDWCVNVSLFSSFSDHVGAYLPLIPFILCTTAKNSNRDQTTKETKLKVFGTHPLVQTFKELKVSRAQVLHYNELEFMKLEFHVDF